MESNNCGSHVLTWAYLLVTSSDTSFVDDDMQYVRKNVCRILLKGPRSNDSMDNPLMKKRAVKILDEDVYERPAHRAVIDVNEI